MKKELIKTILYYTFPFLWAFLFVCMNFIPKRLFQNIHQSLPFVLIVIFYYAVFSPQRLNVLLVAFAATCMSAFADDVVSVNINPTSPSPGDEFAIEVLLDNSEGQFNGSKFEIHMPEGIAPVIESVWNDDDEEYTINP